MLEVRTVLNGPKPFTDPSQCGPVRFRDYQDVVSLLWQLRCPDDHLARFDWRFNLHYMGVAVLARTKATMHISARPPSLVAEAGLDHILVFHRQSGWGHIKTDDDGENDVGAGDISFIDLSRPMWTTGSQVDTVCMGLPRSMLAPLLRDVDALHGFSLRSGTTLGRLAGAHLDALSAGIETMSPTEARVAAEATAALLAVCVNGGPAGSEAARVRARPALVVTIRHHIEKHLSDPAMNTAVIARHFGVSRTTLYRLFQPFGGVDSYIRRRRLARAYHTLRTPAGRTGDYVYRVAQACGFTSECAFSRAFRREFDVTPRLVAMGTTTTRKPAEARLSEYLHAMVFDAP